MPSSTFPLLRTSLLAGGAMAAREALLADLLAQTPDAVVIIEGLPSGQDLLPAADNIIRLSPACLCCAGNLVLKVHLNRLLRKRPAPPALYIALYDAAHLAQLRTQLSGEPYVQHLQLMADIVL